RRPKLDAKLLDRFLHLRRQISPIVEYAPHRFFDGLEHLLCCNVSVRLRHGTLTDLAPQSPGLEAITFEHNHPTPSFHNRPRTGAPPSQGRAQLAAQRSP